MTPALQAQWQKWLREGLHGSETIARRADGKLDFTAIRRAYDKALPHIMATKQWIDPYFVDWVPLFTPIETQMWSLIRSQQRPYYPQFPVGRFFVDFGNPHKKIAIECDGQRWHTDPAKDMRRDLEFLDMGWRVVRFSGRACFLLPYLPDVDAIPPLSGIDAFEPSLDEILEAEDLGEGPQE